METLRKYWFLITSISMIIISIAGFSIKFYYADLDNMKTTKEHTTKIEELEKKIEALEDRWTKRDLANAQHIQAYIYHLKECSK